jgi:APA family basic amino acid/polyamine antiporter
MPIGILGSLVICTILYIVVAAILTAVVPYGKLSVPDPMAVGIDALGQKWLAPIVKLGAIAGLSSVILVLLMAQPRILWSMARDGLLPPLFAKIHPRYKTPYVTTAITGIAVAVLSGLVPMTILGELVSIGTLSAFVLVCAGVIVLRYRHPEIPRPFRVPGMPWVPILGILICLSQMLGLPLDTWIRLVVWMAIGFLTYFLYGQRHSVLNR